MTTTETPTKPAAKSTSRKFTADRVELLEASRTAAACTRASNGNLFGGGLPALGCIQLLFGSGTCRIAATDLEVAFETQMKVTGRGNAVVQVPAKLLVDVLASADADSVEVTVTVAQAGSVLVIDAGEFTSTLHSIEAEWPRFIRAEGTPTVLDPEELAAAIQAVAFAASTDGARPMLTAVQFSADEEGHLVLTATDSYRLATRATAESAAFLPDDEMNVPAVALRLLAKLVADTAVMAVTVDARQVTFVLDDATVFTTRLVEGEFPNWRQLIPTTHSRVVTVDRKQLGSAVGRVQLFADAARPLVLVFGAEEIGLSVYRQDVGAGEEAVTAIIEGAEDSTPIGINPRFLGEVLKSSEDDEVTIDVQDELKPLLVSLSGSTRHVLMPIRIDGTSRPEAA